MIHSTRERSLADRIQWRIEVEKSFARARRTYRKNRVELWCDRHLVPRLLKLGLQAMGLYARGLENALHPAVQIIWRSSVSSRSIYMDRDSGDTRVQPHALSIPQTATTVRQDSALERATR